MTECNNILGNVDQYEQWPGRGEGGQGTGWCSRGAEGGGGGGGVVQIS